MNLAKLSKKQAIIFAILVIIAAMGVISLASTSEDPKKATSRNIETETSPNRNPQVNALTSSQDVRPAERLEITNNLSKVILRVDNMSCSGCIYTIKTSLSGLKGIQDVLVNLSAGQTEVYYDNAQLEDVNQIADAITASGYPAKITEILGSDQLKKERELAAERAVSFIASVGEWDILRDDFNTELKHAKTRYARIYGDGVFATSQGKQLMDNLKVQIASRLIDEGIQIQEIQKAGYAVDAELVAADFQNFLNEKGIDLEQFKADIEENGYVFEYFMKKFENRVLINNYLNEKILNGLTNRFEKQRRYSTWFNNAKLLTKAVYYDKELERLIQARATGSGCSSGSSCRAGG
jgi:copper chaperone